MLSAGISSIWAIPSAHSCVARWKSYHNRHRADAARRLHTRRLELAEGLISRREKEFLSGFQKAALLTQRVSACPPSYTTARDYLKDVARLLRSSDDLVERGLVAGCLCAVGEI